ncbi:ROK family transcriptional regulator [Sphingomonas sp. H39-1-10]|uniref:ROK family transcriptional regulator n=1 Tax=Sphingomonas pollutisoli TaxID=3030829 RepID=UPI0023B99E20|nr:ROK family transcriptional regulator [Sphingomonas pollutisoli]MDF0490167.1 ROK family transcriptional regulator [Sphingomonas pollutisoli]
MDPFRPLSPNERQLLILLRQQAPLSRAELARRTGLALPTVSRLADGLMGDGLIVAEEKVMMGKMGQPSLPLSLAEHAAYSFGVSVRADGLSVNLVHLSGKVIADRTEIHDGTSRDGVVQRIIGLIGSLTSSADVPPDRVCGIGLALSGFFMADPRRINAPLGMEAWAAADLEQLLRDALGLPVLIENDGSAAAFGEYLYGEGHGYPSFAYLYVDRGLGGGVVLDGKLMRGRRGNAGEFTGMLRPEERKNRPTLTLLQSLLADDGIRFDSIAEMVRGFDPAWPAVQRWIQTTTPVANDIVSAIGALVDPDAVVIGGRLPPMLAAELARNLQFHSVPVRGDERRFPEILVSTLTGDAAALGAGALCFGRYFL